MAHPLTGMALLKGKKKEKKKAALGWGCRETSG
jgi:hypothetical protein